MCIRDSQDPAHLQREIEAFLAQRRREREAEARSGRPPQRPAGGQRSSMFGRRRPPR